MGFIRAGIYRADKLQTMEGETSSSNTERGRVKKGQEGMNRVSQNSEKLSVSIFERG